jgi:hypothetical protein
MALHEELDIFKTAYGLLSLAIDLVRNLPRDIKGSLGKAISDECVKLLVLIARANSATNKVPHLEEMLERAGVVKMLMRALRDKDLLTDKQHARAIQVLASVSKQAGGWKRHSENRPLHGR